MKVTLGWHRYMANNLTALDALYEEMGVEVQVIPSRSTDAVFHRDVAAWTPYGHIMCNMANRPRHNEPDDWFYRTGIEPAFIVKPPGTFEGADLLWLNDSTALIGSGSRTNEEGIAQVADFLYRSSRVHDIDGHLVSTVKCYVVRLPERHDQHLLGLVNCLNGILFTIPWRNKECYTSLYGLGLPVELPPNDYINKGSNWVVVPDVDLDGVFEDVEIETSDGEIMDKPRMGIHFNDSFIPFSTASVVVMAKEAYQSTMALVDSIPLINKRFIAVNTPIDELLNYGGGIACATGIIDPN